jgi:hypothetical protein
MSPLPSKTSKEKQAFQAVIEQYMEIKSVNGTSSCSGFYRGLTKEGGRTGLNPRVVQAGPSEFIADVELAARRALSTDISLHILFFEEFVLGQATGMSTEDRERIEQAVGRMLIARRIFPVEMYFRACDLR